MSYASQALYICSGDSISMAKNADLSPSISIKKTDSARVLLMNLPF
ncbi:MAG TPA: hypothetical protein VJR94_00895 [Candidatus Nitrosocosmicus sp.]|nr:hypothetical protein [Candidatus Nitrosocosmicus sp.]